MPDLEELASSVLCVGFEGSSAQTIPGSELRELAPGGLILFSRNVTDAAGTRAMAQAATEAARGNDDGAPPFVAVDQEGGRVARFDRGASHLPAMLGLGATGDEGLAQRAGRALAHDLRLFGATLNLAPTLDLAIDPANTNIGTRSLGSDPVIVGRLGAALIEAMQERGIAATAKHFPGLGASAVDSHIGLPQLEADAATLRDREFVAFRAAIEAGVKAIMTAHIVTPALDPNVPATLSRVVLTDVLRGELGFAGVCITDSMEMGAIARHFGMVPSVVRAVSAGADCVLVCHSLQTAREGRDALAAAVRSGELPLERLEQAAGRVATLRAWCARPPLPTHADPGLPAAIARGALRVVRGTPLFDRSSAVTVISFEDSAASGVEDKTVQRPSFSLALRRRGVRAEQMRVPLDPAQATIEHLEEVLAPRDGRRLIIVTRRAHLYTGQQRAIAQLLEIDPHALTICALEPFDSPVLARAQNLFYTFGDSEASVEAAASLLTA